MTNKLIPEIQVRSLSTVHAIPAEPVVSLEHRIAFGILCASKACSDPAWTVWADRWLSGEDRSEAAAWTAAEATAEAAAYAAKAASAAAYAADLDLAVIFEEARQYVEGTRK